MKWVEQGKEAWSYLHKRMISYKGTGLSTGNIGLEFGPEGVAVVRAQPLTDDGIFSDCFFHSLSDRAAQPEWLQELVQKRHWQGIPCHVVLHPTHYQLVMTDIPDSVAKLKSDPAALRLAIQDRMHDLFNQRPEELAYDALVLPETMYRDRGRMASVAAMSRTEMQIIAQTIQDSGLKLKSISTSETVLNHLALAVENMPRPSALLRIRSSASLLTVTEIDIPVFSRVIDVGLDTIRRQEGYEDGLQRVMDALTLELQRSLDFYESQSRKHVSHLYVLPTKQNIPGAVDHIKQGMGLEVMRFPFDQFLSRDLLLSGDVDNHSQAYCLAAAGAALRGIAEVGVK